MKKIISILLIGFTINTQAQKKEKTELPLFIKVGFGVNKIKTSDNYNSNGTYSSIALNATIGAETEFALLKGKNGNRISINPSVIYNPTTYKPSTNYDPITNTQVQKVTVQYIILEFPIKYNCALKLLMGDAFSREKMAPFFFGIGPYFSYALFGKYKTLSVAGGQSIYAKHNMSFGNSISDNRTKLDAGYIIKTGIDFGHFKLALQKNIGLLNVYPKDRIVIGNSIRTKGFSFTISYIFSKDRKYKMD